MKILQLCNRVPFPLIDGGAIAMFAMTKSFADSGCEVHTLALNTKKHFVDVGTIPAWFAEATTLHTVQADTDVKAFDAFKNLFSNTSYNLARFDNPEFHDTLKQLLQEHTFDVIQLEGLFLTMYIPTIRNYSKALISMRAHNVEYLIWERIAENTSSPIKKWYLNLLTQRLKKEEISALNKVDCIIPISEIDATVFKSLGAKVPMLVCTAGVYNSLLTKTSALTEKNYLFHIAAMNWQPNVQAVEWFMNKVWQLVHQKLPDVKLFIVGKDMPQHLLDIKLSQVEVSGKVENAHEFMLSKNLMLVPLLSGSGMRIKIIEGMALGKVIISTSIGAEGIDYTHRKNILIADNAQDFVNAIEYALHHPELCEEISKNAKELVKEKYTNSKIVEKLIHFYEQQLARHTKVA